MKYEQFIVNNFDVQGTSGAEFLCRCPWHDDQGKPNLYINADKGVYMCHACGAKGHLNNMEGATPSYRTSDIREKMAQVNKAAVVEHRYPDRWLAQYAFPHPYWTEQRGFSEDMVKKFDLGYDPTHDVCTIPIRDHKRRVMGIITRRLDNEKPKYRYPKGIRIAQELFGSWLIHNRTKVALVEGALDAVACWDARVPALALYGSRLSQDQYTLLKRLGIRHLVIFTDNDAAGLKARWQIRNTARDMRISVAQYRPYWFAKDPGELNEQQRRKAYHSAKDWHTAMKPVH